MARETAWKRHSRRLHSASAIASIAAPATAVIRAVGETCPSPIYARAGRATVETSLNAQAFRLEPPGGSGAESGYGARSGVETAQPPPSLGKRHRFNRRTCILPSSGQSERPARVQFMLGQVGLYSDAAYTHYRRLAKLQFMVWQVVWHPAAASGNRTAVAKRCGSGTAAVAQPAVMSANSAPHTCASCSGLISICWPMRPALTKIAL